MILKVKFLRNLLTLVGAFIILISSVIIWKNFIKKSIHDKGRKVEVIVLEAPSSCENITKRGGYCKLEYNGRVHVKRAGNKFCHLVSGKENVTMLTNGKEVIFLQEYSGAPFVYGLILVVIGIIVMIKGYKSYR